MLTDEQKEQIKEIFKLKKSSDRECRLLGCAFLKQYNLDKIYIRCVRRLELYEYYPQGRFHTEVIYYDGIKKVSKIQSADGVIMILDNIDKPSGKMTYAKQHEIIFPVLKAYSD